MRLARKLVLAVVIGILLVVVAYDYSAVRNDIRDAETRIADDVATRGYGLSVTLSQVVRDSGSEAAEALIARRNQGDRVTIRWVALDVPPTDKRAVDLSPESVNELRQGRPVRIVRGSGRGARLVVYRPFVGQKPVHDLAEASESLDPIQEHQRRRIAGVAVESGVILALAIGAALVLGYRLVGRPVQALAAQARRIGGGDLSQRLELGGHDELSELATEMNIMSERLAGARDRLQAESSAKLKAVEQLRHADRVATVGRLASGVAHELGTPLNVVSGHGSMIAGASEAREEDRESARVIVEQAARMAAIIRQLLDFARRDRARLESGELTSVVDRTVTMLGSLAAQRGVEIRVAPAADVTPVRMDQAQLQQVVANLVLNAIQAMPKGGPVDIELGAVRCTPPKDASGERDCLRLTIADQGTGIAPEDLPHIFEPFFTTKDVGEGTGLGLSVCQGIIEEHGGWIAVDSVVGTGSRFSVYLPAVAERGGESTA